VNPAKNEHWHNLRIRWLSDGHKDGENEQKLLILLRIFEPDVAAAQDLTRCGYQLSQE